LGDYAAVVVLRGEFLLIRFFFSIGSANSLPLSRQILLVKTDWDNNLFCEANDINTGCNWRPSDDRPNMPTHGRWFQIPMSWRLADWVTLSYLDSHQDSCYPYCEQFLPKSVLLHDQDGVVGFGFGERVLNPASLTSCLSCASCRAATTANNRLPFTLLLTLSRDWNGRGCRRSCLDTEEKKLWSTVEELDITSFSLCLVYCRKSIVILIVFCWSVFDRPC
jgi:hypothetical protein